MRRAFWRTSCMEATISVPRSGVVMHGLCPFYYIYTTSILVDIQRCRLLLFRISTWAYDFAATSREQLFRLGGFEFGPLHGLSQVFVDQEAEHTYRTGAIADSRHGWHGVLLRGIWSRACTAF